MSHEPAPGAHDAPETK